MDILEVDEYIDINPDCITIKNRLNKRKRISSTSSIVSDAIHVKIVVYVC